MMPMLEVKDLRKSYADIEVLRGVSLSLARGECYGLLGPNGAGKTTTLRACLGLVEPDAGTISLLGLPVPKSAREARIRLGVVSQTDNLDPDFTVVENLMVYGRYFGIPERTLRERIPQLLDFSELSARANSRMRELSGGMQRRLTLARALINDPDLVFLDEPTTGLDPEERIRFRNLLSDLSRTDTIIILSTHIVGDISSTCNQMALLNDGELVYDGPPDTLVKDTKGFVWKAKVSEDQYEDLKVKFPVISTIPSGTGWEIQFVGEKPDDIEAEEIHPNLEHAYVHFMENKMNHWNL